MPAPPGPAWRALAQRGLVDLSPPEVQHALLELPANRPEYVGVLQAMGDWPARSPIGRRVPSADEVDALARLAGRWRAVLLLDDARALRLTAGTFARAFALDPLYDTGDLLYAAWHDPAVRAEHARRLAEQASLVVRAGPLLSAGGLVLAPDHLPGSWDPRPGWRSPRAADPPPAHAAWAMRTAFVLLYWAERLDAVVCTAMEPVISALEVALGDVVGECELELGDVADIDAAASARRLNLRELKQRWSTARRLSRSRSPRRLRALACVLGTRGERWRLRLAEPSLPEPALFMRRVLNAEDPRRAPPLAGRALRRRPLCLVPA